MGVTRYAVQFTSSWISLRRIHSSRWPEALELVGEELVALNEMNKKLMA